MIHMPLAIKPHHAHRDAIKILTPSGFSGSQAQLMPMDRYL